MDGYFDDDGNPLNPDIVPKPSLCISCKHDDDPAQEIPCTLTRLDQRGEKDFRCEAYHTKQKPNLPDNARRLYELLYGDMALLNVWWKMYTELYFGPPARIRLLNKTAPWFFSRLQEILLKDIILGITRLSDPARRGKFENLSLARLAEEFSAAEYAELTKLLRLRLKSIESVVKSSARPEWRLLNP